MNLFEKKTEICYCVPNGASACAPCRDRLAAKNAEAAMPTIIGIDMAGPDSDRSAFPCDPVLDGMVFDGKFIPALVLSELCPDAPCPNCKTPLETYHRLDGCSCHINPPCSYCCENSLTCPYCDFFLELEDA